MNVVLIAGFGAVGALLRVATDSWLTQRTRATWPLGTVVVNLVGSLVLGVVTGLVRAHGLPEVVLIRVGVGFCGALTTFSTASLEVLALARAGRRRAAGAYALVTLVGCLLAAAVGLAATGGLAPSGTAV